MSKEQRSFCLCETPDSSRLLMNATRSVTSSARVARLHHLELVVCCKCQASVSFWLKRAQRHPSPLLRYLQSNQAGSMRSVETLCTTVSTFCKM